MSPSIPRGIWRYRHPQFSRGVRALRVLSLSFRVHLNSMVCSLNKLVCGLGLLVCFCLPVGDPLMPGRTFIAAVPLDS